MFSEIYTIVEKNFKVIIRSKVSALIVLVGPLILILLVGFAFSNSNLHGVKIGTYAKEYNNATEKILATIQSYNFEVIKEKTKDECINGIKGGNTHLCIIFTDNSTSAQKKLEFYADYSRLNLVYTLLSMLSEGMSRTSTAISLGITQDLMSQVKSLSKNIKEKESIIDEFKNDINNLNLKINEINSNVNSIDIEIEIPSDTLEYQSKTQDNKKDIAVFRDSVNSDVQKYDANIVKVMSSADEAQTNLIEDKNQIDTLLNNATEMYSELKCSEVQKTDLNLSADFEDIKNRPCDILESLISTITIRREQLDSSIKQIGEIKNELQNAKKDLSKIKNTVNNMSSNAETNLDEIDKNLATIGSSLRTANEKIKVARELKTDLANELSGIKQIISTSSEKLDTFKFSITELANNLESLTLASPESIIKPIQSEIKPIINKKSILDYIFPSLIVLIVSITSILLSSTLIMKEKSSQAYFRNLITPTKNRYFIIGTYVSAMILVFFQCVLIFTVSVLFFDLSLSGQITKIGFLLIIIVSNFTMIGMFVGYLFKSEETTTLASIFVSIILFLFSSMIIPLEKMQEGLAAISQVSPFVLSEISLRQVILFQSDLSTIAAQIYYLIFYLVILSSCVIVARKINKYFMSK